MTDKPELKPCPFCGGTDLEFDSNICWECNQEKLVQATIECKKCDCTMYADYDDALIKKWNTRHDEAVLDEIEHRFSCVLEKATGGMMSKTNYDKQTMYTQIDEFLDRERQEAYQEGYDWAKKKER